MEALSCLPRVELPPDPVTGVRRKFNKTFRSDDEAEKARTRILAELDGGTAVLPSKLAMRDLGKRWLEDEISLQVRGTTLAGYRTSVEKHVVPRLGNISVQQLTPLDVQRWRTNLLRDTSPRVTQLALQRLNQMLEWAVSADLIAKKPAAKVAAPKCAPREHQSWTPEEAQQRLIAVRGETPFPLWLKALTTEMRRGEVLGLRWQDVDFVNGTALVRQSVVLQGGEAIIQQDKTTSSQRKVRISEDIVATLRAHGDMQQFARAKAGERWQNHGLVFASSVGTPMSPRNLGRSFDAEIEKSGVRRIRLHDLRHTSASIDLAHGTSVKAVAARLGHADASITLRVYGHVLPHEESEAAQHMGRLLRIPAEQTGYFACTPDTPCTFQQKGTAQSRPFFQIRCHSKQNLGCLTGHDPVTSCSTDKRSAD